MLLVSEFEPPELLGASVGMGGAVNSTVSARVVPACLVARRRGREDETPDVPLSAAVSDPADSDMVLASPIDN
jgi:hypothetical protein